MEMTASQRTQLEHLQSILASTQIGTWTLSVEPGKKSRLQPDNKMREIMGIPPDSDMTDEDIAEMLETRVHPKDRHTFDKISQRILAGERVECTYRWMHPTMGERYMRSGGVKASVEGEVVLLNGYHYDVTDQMAKEIRSYHIIKTFAQTYEFINYINLDDDSFYTYTEKEIDDDAIIKVLMAGSATAALRIGVEEIVADEHREEMRTFLDLTTINERMAQSNVITNEFQDVRGVWFESTFTVAERKGDGTIKYLLWAIRFIDNEKQIELKKQKQLEDNIAANKAKTKFLQNMSHEIRTPLNAMFGFAQLLGMPDGCCTEEEKAQYNAYIYNSYKMLEMLISDIIDVADSEHGNYSIEITDILLNETCRNALQAVEFRVPAGVKAYFTSDCPDDYHIQSDGRRIQQVLINYLTNACKNTQEGEIHLHCSLTEKPGHVTFSVTDTGCGVPPEKAALIFNRFTKLNEFVQGSGLGLNICQTIAEKLGGEVYLDTTYTQGARFVFEI